MRSNAGCSTPQTYSCAPMARDVSIPIWHFIPNSDRVPRSDGFGCCGSELTIPSRGDCAASGYDGSCRGFAHERRFVDIVS